MLGHCWGRIVKHTHADGNHTALRPTRKLKLNANSNIYEGTDQ